MFPDCKNDSYVLCAVSLTIKQIRSAHKLEIDPHQGVSVYVKFLGCKLSTQAERPLNPIQFHETLELRRVIPCRNPKEAVDYVNMARCRVEMRQDKPNRVVILAGTEIYGRDFLVSRDDDEYETSGMIPLNIVPSGMSGSLQKDAVPWVCYSGRVRFTCINHPSYMAKAFKKANLRDEDGGAITATPTAEDSENMVASKNDDISESRNFTTLYELMNKKVGDESPQIRYPLDAFLLYENEADSGTCGQSPRQITLEGGITKTGSVTDLEAIMSSSLCQVSLEDVPSESGCEVPAANHKETVNNPFSNIPKIDDRPTRLPRKTAGNAGPKKPPVETSYLRDKPTIHFATDKQTMEIGPMPEKISQVGNPSSKGQPKTTGKSSGVKPEVLKEMVPQRKSPTRFKTRRSMKRTALPGKTAKLSSSSDSDDGLTKQTSPLEKRTLYPDKCARRDESPRRTVNLRGGCTQKEPQPKLDKESHQSHPSCMKRTKAEYIKTHPPTGVHFDKTVRNPSPRMVNITSSSSSSSLCESISNFNGITSTELKTTRIRTGCNVKGGACPERDWSPRRWEGSKPSYLEVIETMSSKYNPSSLPAVETEGTYCFVFFVCLLILFCIGVYIWLHKEIDIDAKN